MGEPRHANTIEAFASELVNGKIENAVPVDRQTLRGAFGSGVEQYDIDGGTGDDYA